MSDERDPLVSGRYRELEREEPSRALDQSILAAAHRAADRAHAPLVTPAGRHRWYFAVGAAAVLVLAVAVTVHVERDRPDPEAISGSQPAPPIAVQAQPLVKDSPEPPRILQQRKARKADAKAAEAEAKRQAMADAEARQAVAQAEASRQAIAAADAKREAFSAAAPQPVPASPSAAQPRRSQDSGQLAGALGRAEQAHADRAYQETPERWLERIVQLRKDGRHEEAEKELAEFRKRHPDYKLPENVVRP